MFSQVTETANRREFVTPSHILIATDLNDGPVLIPHAVAQAHKNGARVTLVHAIQPSETVPLNATGIGYISPAPLEQEIAQALSEMARMIQVEGVSCDWIAEPGFALNILPSVIERTGATRLIMATHGRGKLGQFLLGSVARQLLGTVNIPVFAIGPHCTATEHVSPRKILHPVSMNGDYRRNVEIAIELARFHQAELTLLHAPDRDVERSIYAGCTLAWAENLFAELLPQGTPEGMPATRISVAFGDRVQAIREEAARIGTDWIIVGVDEEPYPWPMPECTAYKVLAVSKCPVLAICRPVVPSASEAVEEAHIPIAMA